MTACTTSSIEITAAHHQIRYIPADQIIKQANPSLALQIGNRRLIPDQLFALDYGGTFRVCALEIDRGTEPKSTTKIRKSYTNAVQLYTNALENQSYRDHYGITSNLLVLWVFSSRRNRDAHLEIVSSQSRLLAASTLTQVVEGFHLSWQPPPVWTHLIEKPWVRAGHDPVSLL
jgi:hypothetical protein